MFDRLKKRPDQPAQPVGEDAARSMIEIACKLGTQGALMCPGRPALIPIRLTSIGEDSFVARVTSDDQLRAISPLMLAAVCFALELRAYMFQSRVYALDPNWPVVPKMTMELPKVILSNSRRASFRVPVDCEDAAATVRPSNGDHTYRGRIVDVSVTGLRVRFDNLPEALAIDQPVEVEARWRALYVSLSGVIRHLDGTTCGIFFSNVIEGLNIRPPESLRSMVADAEREWLSRRTQSPA